MSARLVLVTGAPRSGTTAVGEMLALNRNVCTLHEPFNYLVGLRDIDRYFQIPGSDECSAQRIADYVEDFVNLRLRFKPGLFPREKGIRRAIKHVIGGRAVNSYRRCKMTPFLETILWKDPFACFAARELADRHNVEVLFTVRNPYAVAASFKRMAWGFDLDDIFRRLDSAGVFSLSDIADDVWARRSESAINGALLWLAIYSNLPAWQHHNSRIRSVNLDDLVTQPLATYQALYSKLGLTWNERVARRIGRAYDSRSSSEQPAELKAHDRQRDLTRINHYWQTILNDNERQVIERIATPLWRQLVNEPGLGQCA